MNTELVESNFNFLKKQTEQLWRLGALAERYFPEDPFFDPFRKYNSFYIQIYHTIDC